MNKLNPDQTVADVATHIPAAKRVFERLGIDYCCGGGDKLTKAAQASGHSLDEIQNEIDKAVKAEEERGVDARDWSSATAGQLAQHILDTHHGFMKTQLPRLTDLFKKVISAHGDQHGDMLNELRRIFEGLKAEIEAHLMKEEQILFPYIFQLDAYRPGSGPPPESHCGTVQNPIRQMEYEHDNAGAALIRMREVTSDYTPPDDACPSFEELYEGLKALETDLHEHIHLENNVLFPKAVEVEERAFSGTHQA